MNLDKKQSMALNRFINGYNLFITGGAGSGKSYLIEKFANYINSNTGKTISITSTTGISALNINGITLHSWAGLDKNTNYENVDIFINKIQNSYSKLNNYLFTDILIIDEVSMLDSDTLTFLNLICKSIRNNNESFGGIQLILVGDFAQLPPVNSNNFAFNSKDWDKIIDYIIVLNTIYRQNEDIMTKFLYNIRNGIIDNLVLEKVEECSKINDILNYTHLYPNKFNVDVKNLIELEKLEGKAIELTANIICKENDSFNEFPDNLNVQEVITLKPNAFIMLTRNIDIEQKLVNGTQGYFKGINDSNKLIFQNDNGIHYISKYLWEFDNFNIEQYPICLAWAITIHKSQGMGIEYLSVDIGNNIFEDGQTYVALSRAKSLNGLHIKSFSKKSVKCNNNVSEFYNNLNKDSTKWITDKINDTTVFINKLDGRSVYKLPKTGIVIDKKENYSENDINNCKYSNYSVICSICNSFGCRNDLLSWYKEKICTECVIKNKDYRQINKTDIYKLFTKYSKKYINEKIKTIPCKIIVNNNRFKTKTKIYLIKILKDYLNESQELNKSSNKIEKKKKLEEISNNVDNIELYNKLKDYRNTQAKKLKLPTYCIFANKTIEELSKIKISSLDDLLLINGIGKNKIDKYGDDILKIINKDL